jgi:hypothetical protein
MSMRNRTRTDVVSPGVHNGDDRATQNSKHPAGIPACCSLRSTKQRVARRCRGCCFWERRGKEEGEPAGGDGGVGCPAWKRNREGVG